MTNKQRIMVWITLVIAACALVLPITGAASSGLTLNLTPSMPRGLYAVDNDLNGLTYHDTVLVCLPPNGVAFAFEHHVSIMTAPTTPCAGHSVMLIKEVLALPGDHVSVSDAGVYVNGRLVPNTVPVPRLKDGTPLPRPGPTVVPGNEVWTWTPAKRSYDSRYWGPMRVYARLSPAHIGPLALTFGKPE